MCTRAFVERGRQLGLALWMGAGEPNEPWGSFEHEDMVSFIYTIYLHGIDKNCDTYLKRIFSLQSEDSMIESEEDPDSSSMIPMEDDRDQDPILTEDEVSFTPKIQVV